MSRNFRNFAHRKNQRHIATKFREEAIQHPELSGGFGLFWLWIWIVFQNDLLGEPLTVGSLEIAPWSLPLFFYALGFFALGTLFKLRRIVPHGTVYLGFVAVAMSGGALLVVTQNAADPLDRLTGFLNVVGYAAIGLGTSCAHVEWGRIIGSRGERAAIIHCASGTLAAAALYPLLNIIPLAIFQFGIVFIPLVFMGIVHHTLRGRPLYRYGTESPLHVPWKFIITSFLQGLSFGVMWSLFLISGQQQVTEITALSFAAAAVAVLVATLLFKMDFNHLIYQVGFLVMALGYVSFSIFDDSAAIGGSINSIGCHFMSILMWSLCAYLIRNHTISANWVFTWTTGSYILGQSLGAIAAGATAYLAYCGIDPLSTICISMVFLILTGALLMLSNKNLDTGWGMVRPGENSENISLEETACNAVGREYDLTPREIEVLGWLAKGRNRHAISKELVLSPNTVKTHIRNIYVKLGVHSQQELIDFMEAERAMIETGNFEVSTLTF